MTRRRVREAGRARAADAPGLPPWKGIHDYGVIGDLATAALVARDGSLEWACFPSFSSPSVFGALLDRAAGGSHRIEIEGAGEAFQRYVPGTNVLRTFVHAGASVVTITDCMPIAGESETTATSRILRRLEVDGPPVPTRVVCAPRFDYGRAPAATWTPAGPTRLVARAGHDALGATFPVSPTVEDGIASASMRLVAGRPVTIELTWGGRDPLPSPGTALDATSRFWRYWVRRPDAPMHRRAHVWFDWVERSELVLKLLSRGASGAFVAAPTTSLPEWIGGARNWDYRYVWVRDAAFAAQAFLLLGHLREARAYVRWVLGQLRGTAGAGPLGILYSPGDDPLPAEAELDHWEGYRGSKPVRIGNAASEQLQIDIYGELLDAADQLSTLDPAFLKDAWPQLARLADGAVARWKQPDSGIWEFRTPPAHFVHSKVMAWVAADRGARLAGLVGARPEAQRFRATADAMRVTILDRGWSDALGSFVQTYDGDRLDASLLRLPMTGFLPWDDPRVHATVERVEERLARGPFVYRYEGSDGLEGPEGSFLLCAFWLVECLARTGDRHRALRNFRSLLRAASPLRLFSEEYDPVGREPLGNYPQAFAHIGLLRAALALGDADEEADETATAGRGSRDPGRGPPARRPVGVTPTRRP